MSERFTVRLARIVSAALGPNPLDAICPDMPRHEVAPERVLRLIKGGRRSPHARYSAA